MKCVFLSVNGKCYAEMIAQRGGEIPWEVDEPTKKDRCMTGSFDICPRFKAKMAAITRSR